jgi:phospholipid/cholesterol/gamma-HCH transport system substrate-binding protein
MPARNNVEFRVGVVALMALAVLLLSLYWLQGYKLERNAQKVNVLFKDVGTLSVGDRVTVSGVHRGKVNRLSLTERGVQVELLLYRDVVLHRDAQFIIKNLGLMGERFIAIEPGMEKMAFDTAVIALGAYDTGLPEVMGLMGEMITELRNLVTTFRRTVGSDSSLEKFNRTVSNMEQMSHSLADYVSRNESKLDQTAENFLSASREFNRMFARNGSLVDSTAQRFERASGRIENFAGQLDTLAKSARTFADALNNGDGTLQSLVEDRRLYDDLRKAANNLDDLVNDIKANPRKYINLKVELF